MKKNRFAMIIIAALFAMPMLFVACSEDEPTPTPPEDPEVENPNADIPGESEEIKPILFETKGTYWFTEYDALNNLYSTLCVFSNYNNIEYVYADGVDNPAMLSVKQFTIESVAGTETVDISELERQASENPNGYFNVTLEGVTLKYEQEGKFAVEYDEFEFDIMKEEEWKKANDRYYVITLGGDDDRYSTTIRINDVIQLFGTGIPISLDLSAIEYPCERSYDIVHGSKYGTDYMIYLPATACEFPIISISDFYDHLYILNDDLQTVEEEWISEVNCYYVKQCEMGTFTHKEKYKIDCKITANTTGQERTISLPISFWKDGIYGDCAGADVHIIQSAE